MLIRDPIRRPPLITGRDRRGAPTMDSPINVARARSRTRAQPARWDADLARRPSFGHAGAARLLENLDKSRLPLPLLLFPALRHSSGGSEMEPPAAERLATSDERQTADDKRQATCDMQLTTSSPPDHQRARLIFRSLKTFQFGPGDSRSNYLGPPSAPAGRDSRGARPSGATATSGRVGPPARPVINHK
jgi:hypothetical protein